MLSGEKVLVTGPGGRIALAVGVATQAVDLGDPDFSSLPEDFTYLLHIAADFSEDYERGLRVNAEGTGLLLSHCRNAKAALVMSTVTVYKPHPDPWHAFTEGDPIGDAGLPSPQPYSIVKIAEEAVARYCAREFDLPITIARMGSAYGDRGGLPLWHLRAIAEGNPVTARWDPLPYSPIHYDDINRHIAPLLDAASVPATIVNFAGDSPVTVQQWSKYFADLLGVQAEVRVEVVSGASVGSVGDHAKRTSITGPCTVDWRDGFRDMAAHHYPDRVKER